MRLPTLKALDTERETISAIGGYNHNLRISDNEWFDMQNLSSSLFPVMSTRNKRGVCTTIDNPQGMITKDTLAYVDGADLVYNGLNIPIGLSTDDSMCPKQMISMGAYLLIWPDKKWLNTVDMEQYGSMEHTNTTTASTTITLCQQDGSAYTNVSSAAPENPDDGALWMDTGDGNPVLKRYSAQSGMWVSIPTTYLKMESPLIGADFSAGDGVSISGYSDELSSLNGSYVIEKCEDGYIVVTGILSGERFTEESYLSVSRSVPDMDYVCECGNRIWGCKYGFVDGKTVNEIYASKLGDFKNWNVFEGLSTDSYAASRGSDGPFTGAIAHLGYPLFFKENCVEKVYPSATGAHQIVNTECRGVQKGCWRSLEIVNEVLYYKSREGICAYRGALPEGVYAAFGDIKYSNARAGALGYKYYVSMQDSNDAWHMFVYDTQKGLWHREDDTKALCFAEKDGELYYIDDNTKTLMSVNGTDGAAESDFSWSATSGVIGFEDVEHKYIGRFLVRADLAPGANVYMEINYDSEDEWYTRVASSTAGLHSFLIPVLPRRCDHMRIRLHGTGGVKIYSISKIKEKGSDAGWR